MSDKVGKWAQGFLEKSKTKITTKIKVKKWEKSIAEAGKEAVSGGGGNHIHVPIYELDLAGPFAGLGLKNLKIPASLPVTTVLDIDGPGADKFSADGAIQAEVQQLAKDQVNKFAADFAKQLKEADAKPLTKKQQAYVDKILLGQANDLSTKVSIELTTLIVTRLTAVPQYKKDVKKWKVKAGCKIGLSSFVIVGSAVVTGLTWGAASPAAVVAIARSGVALGETIFKLAADLDTIGGLVKIQLKAIEKILTDSKSGNSAKEAGLGVASGILGTTMLPSVKNCTEHLETYEIKLKDLMIDKDTLGPQVYQMMDSVAALDAAPLPADPKAKKAAEAFLKAAESTFEALLVTIEKTAASITKGQKNLEEWEEALKARPVAEWTKYVSTVASAVTDLALSGGGGADEALMAGLAVLTSAEASLADFLLEKV